jgi:cell division protein FtsB
VIFFFYTLFLDDVDIFTIIRQEIKLSKLEQEKEEILSKYEKTKSTLDNLDDLNSLEKYAREEKMFKRDDEDIFVIVEKK